MWKFYQTARSITCKFQPWLNCIKAKNGEVITETNEISEWWWEYCEELYDNTSTGQERYEPQDSTQEPPPLRSEVECAIRNTAEYKACRPDEVPVELIQSGGETVILKMHEICTALWETGE